MKHYTPEETAAYKGRIESCVAEFLHTYERLTGEKIRHINRHRSIDGTLCSIELVTEVKK